MKKLVKYSYALFILFNSSVSFCKDNTFIQSDTIVEFSKINKVKVLNGKWEFFFNELLTPQEIKAKNKKGKLVELPNSWTSFENGSYSEYGNATFKFRLNIDDTIRNSGLYIPKIWCAQKTWVNGKLTSRRGQLGKDNYKNLILEDLVYLGSINNLEIVVQVSNYSLFVGGIIEPFRFGNYKDLKYWQSKNSSYQIFWLGCLFLFGIYLMLLFKRRKKLSFLLYFGIICFLITIKMSVFGNHFLYEYLKTEWLSFKWQSSLYYITTYMLAAIGLKYIASIYRIKPSKKIINGFFTIICIYCGFVFITPVNIFSPTILPFQIIVFLCVLYMVYIIIIAHIKGRANTKIQIVGIIIIILAAINDLLSEFGINITNNHELIPYSFIATFAIQVFIISRDFTHRLEDMELQIDERTNKIAEQNKSLKLLSKEKDDLIRFMAHDLKAPFGNIYSLIELIKADFTTDKEIYEYTKLIQDITRSSQKLIVDFLDLDSIKNGRIKLVPEPIDLNKLIKILFEEFKPRALSRNIELKLEIAENSIMIINSEKCLKRILSNLISNAIKFSEKNTKVRVVAKKLNNKESIIEIIDQGPGFTENDKQNIFKKFGQLSAKPKTKEPSTGLGLSIVYSFVQQIGAEINLISEVGLGSTFRIKLNDLKVNEYNKK